MGEGWPALPDRTVRAVLAAARAAGVTLFDTAPFYGDGRAERMLGDVLGEDADAVIVTKVGLVTAGPDDPVFFRRADGTGVTVRLDRDTLRRELDACRRRLRHPRLGAVLVHWPDATRSPEQVGPLFEQLVAAGEVATWGVSNVAAADLPRWLAFPHARVLQESVDPLAGPEAAARRTVAHAAGATVLGHSALAQGLLTGRRPRSGDFRAAHPRWLDPSLPARRARLRALARQAGLSPTRMLLGHALSHAEVTAVLVGARTVNEARALADGQELPPELATAVDAALAGPAAEPLFDGWV